MSLHVVPHRQIPEDPKLQRQWNDLALQMERPEVFYTWEWALAVQSAYSSTLKPLLLLGYDQANLVGVASLATYEAGKNVGFLAATTADYCDFISAAPLRAEFADAVFAQLKKINSTFIVLANFPEDSATPAAIRAAARNNHFHSFARPAYLCAQVELGSLEQRQRLKSALAGKRKLRRYLRAMEREGPVTFAHLQDYARIKAALPGFAAAHVARFQATHRLSSLATPERRLFLEELARRFSGTGVVALSLLMVGNRPVAWNYGFQFHGTWFWYQPTFDDTHEDNSPGHCLLSRIIVEACDMNDMTVVDMGLGAEGYKERFANSFRTTLNMTITASPFRHLWEVSRYQVVAQLKRSTTIESVIRRLLGRLS